MNVPDETPAAEVIEVVDWLESANVVYQINGGWGVDALVGRRTRAHRDVDVFVDVAHEEEFLAWLLSRGYRVIEDWRPVRVELAGERGRVDVHPMRLDDAGNGVQQGLGDEVYVHAARDRVRGRIGGRPVVVACAERLRELRTGYPARDIDRHDLAHLDALSPGGG